jgi:uridine kinase
MNKQWTEHHIILVGGGSCSEVHACQKHFRELAQFASVEKISIDDYYKDLSGRSIETLDDYNFDTPDAIDSKLLFNNLNTLRRERR